MFAFVCIVVQVVDPGAIHGAHVGDEVVDREGVKSILSQCVLHTVLSHPEFVNICERIRRQLKGYPSERAIGELNGKWLLLESLRIYQLDAIQDRLVMVVIAGYV